MLDEYELVNRYCAVFICNQGLQAGGIFSLPPSNNSLIYEDIPDASVS